MITVSEAFRNAMAGYNPQRPMIEFAGGTSWGVFTADDISVEQGITYNESLNTDTDLTMGGCPSSTLSFTLLNRRDTLRNFEFGRCKASIGVRLSHTHVHSGSDVRVQYDTNKYIVWNHSYFTIDGQVLSTSPVTDDVMALYLMGQTLLCIYSDGTYDACTFNGTTLTSKTFSVYDFMTNKFVKYAAQGIGIHVNGNIVTECYDGYVDVWEYCPLGVFMAQRPKVVRGSTIGVSCNDLMSLMDEDLPTDITYPITLSNLLQFICTSQNVSCKSTTFLNSTYTVTKKPSEFKNASCRDVIGWIAEAACSYARFDRDGALELVWFSNSGVTLKETDYSEYEQYWYETKPIGKLVIRDDDYSTDTVIGDDDDNAYMIEDNPFIRGGT